MVRDMLHDPGQWFAFVLSGWTTTWPTQLLAIIWILWVISWVLASFWSGQTQETRDDLGVAQDTASLFSRGPFFSCHGPARFWGKSRSGSLAALASTCWRALSLAGISFTWWARIHLGRFWSNAITHKEGHQVIDTGPYGLVRHPIYTGLIVGMLVTGVAVGTVTAMLGAVLISLGMWLKARMEEGFLTAELGADAYGSYCRRVPMLIPFLPPT